MSSDAPFQNELFELTTPRTILIQDRERSFALTCRRIIDADWLAYFAAITITSEQHEKSRINTVDTTSPRLKLAESTLVDASGYQVAGGGELTSIPGWQQRIPLSHRVRLGQTLSDVRPSEQNDDLTIYPEGEVALLDATYTALTQPDECGIDRHFMLQLKGLKHVLKTPSEEQHRRFMRESSRSKIVGGSRNGKTIYPVAHPLLAKLYDELVISVEGYSVNGTPLTTDSTTIRAEMDMLHKVIAAQQLFQPLDTTSLGGDNDE